MSLRQHGTTAEMEEALANLEAWAKRAGVKLRWGRHLGKSPQSGVVDVEYQDGLFHVGTDGDIEAGDTSVYGYEGFCRVVFDAYGEAKPEKYGALGTPDEPGKTRVVVVRMEVTPDRKIDEMTFREKLDGILNGHEEVNRIFEAEALGLGAVEVVSVEKEA